MGGACEKKSESATDNGAIEAADRAGSGAAGGGTIDSTPLTGVDLGKLDADKQKVFYNLLGSLTSPCGQSHSLRTSFTQDTACKRAPYAVRYLVQLLDDEASADQAREEYVSRYQSGDARVKIDTSKSIRVGTNDAPIRIVEFFDYACPHCAETKQVFDEIAEKHGSKVAEYFLMFPLGRWPDSKSAGQAAYAAAAQGKFKEMHAVLFTNAPRHSKADVTIYATRMGLDMAKFESDYAGAAAQVDADHTLGKSLGVSGTPAIFINERKYAGPLYAKYFELWIEEELAVNR